MVSLFLKTCLYKKNSSSLDKSEYFGNSPSELKCASSAFNVALTADTISSCAERKANDISPFVEQTKRFSMNKLRCFDGFILFQITLRIGRKDEKKESDNLP